MRSTTAHIDLDALRWNYSLVRRRAASQKILGMVKANAYGHGMIAIARELAELGIDMLGTAFVDEAVEIRSHGIETDIIVLTPAHAYESHDVAKYGFHVVACDLAQMRALSLAAVACGSIVPVHLYVDTGMMREGFRPHDALDAADQISALPGLRLVGLCTHFATADNPTSPFLHQQLNLFKETRVRLETAGHEFTYVHAANSGALWMDHATHFSMVRTGLSLYGYALGAEPDMALRPVMSVRSQINSKRKAWPGESISYGQRYVVTEECTIATVPIGYGDGYLRGLTGVAECIIGGKRYPAVGSICMDEIMVNLGEDDYPLDEPVVLLGRQGGPDGRHDAIDAIELAHKAQTIPYEILTAVSLRVPRVYDGGSTRQTASPES